MDRHNIASFRRCAGALERRSTGSTFLHPAHREGRGITVAVVPSGRDVDAAQIRSVSVVSRSNRCNVSPSRHEDRLQDLSCRRASGRRTGGSYRATLVQLQGDPRSVAERGSEILVCNTPVNFERVIAFGSPPHATMRAPIHHMTPALQEDLPHGTAVRPCASTAIHSTSAHAGKTRVCETHLRCCNAAVQRALHSSGVSRMCRACRRPHCMAML